MRTHDDPPLEYRPSRPGETPLIVEMLKLEGVFPPEGCVNVSIKLHEEGYPVLIYEVALTDDEWQKVKRALDSMPKGR